MRKLAGSILKNADGVIFPSAQIAEMHKVFIIKKYKNFQVLTLR